MSRFFRAGLAIACSALQCSAIAGSSESSATDGIAGVVRLPDGTPAPEARLFLCREDEQGLGACFVDEAVAFYTRPEWWPDQAVADGNGRFSLPDRAERAVVVAFHERGYGEALVVRGSELVVRIQPWGRVEGIVRRGAEARPDVPLRLVVRTRASDAPRVTHVYEARSDAEGRFRVERLPTGDATCGPLREPSAAQQLEYEQPLRITEGRSTNVVLGGVGRPVVGRIVPPTGVIVDLAAEKHSVRLRKQAPIPENVREEGGSALKAWWKQWQETEAGRRWSALPSHFTALLTAEGVFRFDEVPPGDWTLLCEMYGREVGPIVGRVLHEFSLPEMPAGADGQTPLDLGGLSSQAVVQPLPAGVQAPDFAVSTLDGRAIKLSEFRGKYVLLEFWATWCGPCVMQVPKLKAVHEKYGGHEQFVMLSLSLDRARDKLTEFVQRNELRWVQVLLEGEAIVRAYHVTGVPHAILIGPDGTILAPQIHPDRLDELLARVLTSH